MPTTNKPKTIFWNIAISALIWNIMGLFQFVSSTFMQDLIAESISEEELRLINDLPNWYTVFFGISTIVGFLACVTMLMRKKVTVLLFLISLIAVLVSQGYWILGTHAIEVLGYQAIVMPLVVIVISFFLYFYNKDVSKKKWIN